MKIAHVGLDLVPSSGGSVVSVRDFSRVTESTIISFTTPHKLRNELSAIPGTVHVETTPGFFGRAFAWAVKAKREAALRAVSDADRIVCHLLWRYHVHWTVAVARKKRIPYWVVPHGGLDPYVFSYRSLVKKVWLYLFGRKFLENAEYVIFATEKERAEASTYYDGSNCRVIHWQVQSLDLTRRDRARDAVCSKHRIAREEKIILFLGRLHSSKRPLEIIKSFSEARVQGVHLLMVGPEETIGHADCRALIEELRVDKVHLVGAVYGEDKNDYLLASDVYISLSEKENFGYTTAEALSAGVPVILSPGNYLAEELQSLQCGWMLTDNSLETAVAAIREFSDKRDEELGKMGQRGRNWALEHLSFGAFAEKIKRLANTTPG